MLKSLMFAGAMVALLALVGCGVELPAPPPHWEDDHITFERGVNFVAWFEQICGNFPDHTIQHMVATAVFRDRQSLTTEYFQSLCPPKPAEALDPLNMDSSRVTLAQEAEEPEAPADVTERRISWNSEHFMDILTGPTIDLRDWVDADLLESAGAGASAYTWDTPVLFQVLREIRALRQSCLLGPMPELGVR